MMNPRKVAAPPKKRGEERRSHRAMRLINGRHETVLTTACVSELEGSARSPTRARSPDDGFQREQEQSRVESICKCHVDGKIVPTMLIMAVPPEAEPRYDQRTQTFSYKPGDGALILIDGQHRFAGALLYLKRHGIDLTLPIAVIFGLSLAEQARLFLEVNTLQKGVSAALLADVAALAETESELDSLLRWLLDRLAADERSPLFGRVSAAGLARGKLNRAQFNRALRPVLRKGEAGLDRERLYLHIRAFLVACAAVLGKDVVARPAVLGAAFDVMKDVVSLALDRHKNARSVALATVTAPFASLDAEALKGGRAAVATRLRDALRGAVTLSPADVDDDGEESTDAPASAADDASQAADAAPPADPTEFDHRDPPRPDPHTAEGWSRTLRTRKPRPTEAQS